MTIIGTARQKWTEDWVRPEMGQRGAPVLIVCEPQSWEALKTGTPMTTEVTQWFRDITQGFGFKKGDLHIVGLCPPITDRDKNSAKRQWEHVQAYQESLVELVRQSNAKLVVTFGALASRAILGRAVKITKARGQAVMEEGLPPVLPMLSPGYVNRIPEHVPTFKADMLTLHQIMSADFVLENIERTETNYEWCTDISDFLGKNKPKVIALDTETTGLTWWDASTVVLTVQFSVGPGMAIVCPVDERYWPWFEKGERERLVAQLKELLEDKSVRKIGHNIKFDHVMLRKLDIHVKGWLHDTQLLAFAVDENLLSKALSECTRIFVPEMAGYSDDFDRTYDKSNMRAVPHDDMLAYGGGDPDATFRLARVLVAQLRQDSRQWNCYRRIMVPAIMQFADVVERYGMLVDKDALRSFGKDVGAWLKTEYKELIKLVPVAVRRKHLNSGKKLEFSREDFVIDTLFTDIGFGLKPLMYTKGTADLEDEKDKRPSVSAKDHLPYFTTEKAVIKGGVTIGDFVLRLIQFKKNTKLYSTYIGQEEEGNGFWQYLDAEGAIHPSYMLHNTNTGRTASNNPNGQNLPKRGNEFAEAYTKIFKPRPGYVFVAADLSQIELRLVAWMAGEREMLRLYNEGADIHAATAAAVLGITLAELVSWKDDERLLSDHLGEITGGEAYLKSMNPEARSSVTIKAYYKNKRFGAKGVNFGFVYGMGWRKFMIYAKTEYGITYSPDEAQHIRNVFFETYPDLIPWHNGMKDFLKEHGYVRALHGALRRLPSVYSNDQGIRAQAERQAINAPIQRFGSDVGLLGMIRFGQCSDPDKQRCVAFIHDQLVTECRADLVEEGASALKWVMESVPLPEWFDATPPLPILSEVEVGDTLGTMVERPDVVARRPDWFREAA